MAKGNLFQGMGRGKVGDVVFSRLNGQQIARVRNRNPKNPRTNAQLYQRAIMATVMQAYSAGIEIFDHSFQGKEVGAQNQRRFMQLNAKLLRSQIAADINGSVAVASQVGRVVAPGVSSPVPACLQISEGSLVNVLMSDKVPALAQEGEKVGAYCSRLGITANDIFTLVGFVVPAGAGTLYEVNGFNDNYSKQMECYFVFARYTVKPSALTDNENTLTHLDQILELSEANYNVVDNIASVAPGNNVPKISSFYPDYEGSAEGVSAWIRSKENEDLRSTETLIFDGKMYGIASEYALAAWKQGTANLGNSDLILEGGEV